MRINAGRLRAALWWSLTIAWAGVIFGLSMDTFSAASTGWWLAHLFSLLRMHLSANVFNWLHNSLRKLAHLSEYAILALLLYHAHRPERRVRWCLRTAIYVLLIAAAYSLSDEFHQRFIPSRHASLMDCGTDTLGAALGVMATYATSGLIRQRTSEPSA